MERKKEVKKGSDILGRKLATGVNFVSFNSEPRANRRLAAKNSYILALTNISGSTRFPPSLGRLGSSMVEQLTLNQLVSGSSPDRGTTLAFVAEEVNDTHSQQPQERPARAGSIQAFRAYTNLAPKQMVANRAFYGSFRA